MTSTDLWELPMTDDVLDGWSAIPRGTVRDSLEADAAPIVTLPASTPGHCTVDAAAAAADLATDRADGELLYITAEEHGYQWHALVGDVPTAGGWLVRVRTADGVWLDFPNGDHARDFLRVEAAIVATRHQLLNATQKAATDPANRSLPTAAHWSQVLTVLRAEREQLYPDS